MITRPILAALAGPALCMLASCADFPAGGIAAERPGRLSLTDTAPSGAPPGSCWAVEVSPAVIETVTRDILIKPAQVSPDGRIQSPPVYRSETRQEIVQPRQERFYEVPCPAALTQDFVASLQRALAARGFYSGVATGSLDRETQDAIRRYQAQGEGPDSGILTVDTARRLGLWTVDLDAAAT